MGLVGDRQLELHAEQLKLSVPDETHRAAIKGLGLDPVEAQPRQAFFFDTPDLALNRAGVVVGPGAFRAGGPTRSSSCAPWTPTPSTSNSSARRASRSRWTRCRADTCARPRTRAPAAGRTYSTSPRARLPLALALFEGAARVLRRARAGGRQPGRAADDSVRCSCCEPSTSRRPSAAASSSRCGSTRRFANSRDLDQVPARRRAFQAAAEFKAYIESCGIPVTGSSRPRPRRRWSSSPSGGGAGGWRCTGGEDGDAATTLSNTATGRVVRALVAAGLVACATRRVRPRAAVLRAADCRRWLARVRGNLDRGRQPPHAAPRRRPAGLGR